MWGHRGITDSIASAVSWLFARVALKHCLFAPFDDTHYSFPGGRTQSLTLVSGLIFSTWGFGVLLSEIARFEFQ